MGGSSQIISSHIWSGSNHPIPGAGANLPQANDPQKLSDVAVGKGVPSGAKNVVEGEVPDYKVALKGPPPSKISAHDQFVRNLYAEVSKLSSKRSVGELDGLVKTATAVDKGAKEEVKRLVTCVKTSIAALNKLTGRQIADFSRVSDQTAFKALCEVLNAHEDLALALTRLGQGKETKVSRPLQEAANGLNKRICAITQLVGELNAQLLRADSSGLDLRNQFDRVDQFAGQRSGEAEVRMSKLKALTRPLEDVLKGFGSTSGPITQRMVSTAQGKLKTIKADVDFLAACASGKRKLTEGDKTRLVRLGWLSDEIVGVPQSVFEDLRTVLDRASKQLGQAHLQNASKAAARRTVDALQVPGAQQISNLKALGSDAAYKNFLSELELSDEDPLPDLFKDYEACTKACEALRKAVQAEVDGRNPKGAKEAVRLATETLAAKVSSLNHSRNYARMLLSRQVSQLDDDTDKKLIDERLEQLDELNRALNAGEGVIARLKDQIATIRTLNASEPKGLSWYDPQVMSRILDEPEVFMAVVEARVHGIDLSLVDLDCSTKNLLKKEPLGSGSFSTAYLCTFKRPDGSTVQRVFKPDRLSTEGLSHGIHGTLGGGTKGLQRALDYNVALHDVATLLDAGSTVCHSSAAYVDGEFGFLMEVAPGVGSSTAAEKNLLGKSPDGEEFKLEDFNALQKDRQRAALAQMAEQLNQLQWTDLIGGQLDRHAGNYAVNVTGDGLVTIKGYDNDQSLAAEMVGIGKIRVPGWKYLLGKINKSGVRFGMSREVLQGIFTDAGTGRNQYQEDAHGRLTFDVREMQSAAQLSMLIQGTGLRSIAVPSYMTRGTYDRIKALTKDAAGLKLFRETLEKRGMTPGQIDSAVTRLREASKIADDLMEACRVYTREQLAQEKFLREIIDGDSHLKKMLGSIPTSSGGHTNLFNTAKKFGSDYLQRPPFYDLIDSHVPQNAEINKMEVPA